MQILLRLRRGPGNREQGGPDRRGLPATRKLLKVALGVLKKTFDMWSSALVLKQVPPVRFKTYKLNESAGGVMGLVQQIINDAKACG